MNVESVLNLSDKFCYWAEQPLDKIAAAKKKKVDPKAKVRNRGTVCVPAASAKDKKDHFPINNEAQARNALARVHQYSTVPSWYKGSLKGLQALVARKVKAKYPKIDVGGKDKKKKSSLEVSETLLNKYANHPLPPSLQHITLDEVAETLPVSKGLYGVLWGLMPSDKENPPYEGEMPPEPDHSSRRARSLKKFWHKLTPEQQQEIIDAKARDEAEIASRMAKYMTVEKKSDLEIGLQKQGALKEHIDSDLDYLIRGLSLTRAATSSVIQKLEKVKSTYTVEFDPELEHSVVENMPRMKEGARNNFVYLKDLSKRLDELLKRIESASTKSSRGPISAPNV